MPKYKIVNSPEVKEDKTISLRLMLDSAGEPLLQFLHYSSWWTLLHIGGDGVLGRPSLPDDAPFSKNIDGQIRTPSKRPCDD